MAYSTFILVFSVSVAGAVAIMSDNSVETTMSTPQLIKHRGYPTQTHKITTDDGYILTMHRVPAPGNPVVFLQHGFLGSSADFLINTNKHALGFALYDAGYDVWLGNFRGNTYSKRHDRSHQTSYEFWNFSWDEIGCYDVPAMIDYVLETTDQGQLNYIGHSVGTTAFFIASELYPLLDEKIRLMISLGPIAKVTRMKSTLRDFGPHSHAIQTTMELFGDYEFLPNNKILQIAGEKACKQNNPYTQLCSNLLFLLSGHDASNLDPVIIPSILSHAQASTSTRVVLHFAQEYNNKNYARYDYGPVGNSERYKQPYPPLYHATGVAAAVVILWAQNDYLATPEDVGWLALQLPNLKAYERVGNASFGHLDFLWAKDAETSVIGPVLKYLKKFDDLNSSKISDSFDSLN